MPVRPGAEGQSAAAWLKDLRDFIRFARGELVLNTVQTQAAGETQGIAASVCRALEEMGFKTHVNIGCSECKVDIGVLNEDETGYRLGILLDDFEARFDPMDYEITIPAMLRQKGWQLYRLQSLNWHSSRQLELAQLRKLLH